MKKLLPFGICMICDTPWAYGFEKEHIKVYFKNNGKI